MKRKKKSSKPSLKFSFKNLALTFVLLVGVLVGLNVVTNGEFNLFGFAYNRWPFTNSGTPPNVMLEKDTLKVITYDDTNELSISGNIVFAGTKHTGAECWVVWATLEPDGKRIGNTFPLDSNELYPPKEKCPTVTIGKFNAGPDYPAKAERIVTDPLPHQNEGILKNAQATPYRNFIFNVPVPTGICKLYLHYRSNRQGGNKSKETVFYEVRLPIAGCSPSPTPATPTVPIPTTVTSPEGCAVLEHYNTETHNNYSTCQEYCGSFSGKRGVCRAGKLNPAKTNSGEWFCCTSNNCRAGCRSDSNCANGLLCISGRCQDEQTCAQTGTCQCKADIVEKRCNYWGSDCKSTCDGTCHADNQCGYQSPNETENVYCAPDTETIP